jgi:beta-glucosidase
VAALGQTCSNKQTASEIDARIDGLIAKMTVDERIAQLGDQAPAIARLGLPGYNWWNEGLHGTARNGFATVFPQAIGLAATWDPALLQQVGDTVSTEGRASFNGRRDKDSPRYAGLTYWSPNINIFRDPRWGRGQETYGEDPFLTARLGEGFVRGVQGSDGFYRKADATPKHFVAHSGPEEGRDGFNSVVSAHDLEDTYLVAFHDVTGKAHADALMCSYNAINGTPSCANSGLLEERVRKGWGFGGYVVSDCDAVGNLTTYQHYTKDAAHGAAASLKAGVDLDCGKTYDSLREAYAQKLVTEAEINLSLHRLLMARVRLGLLDPKGCSPFDGIGENEKDSEQHRMLARRAAEESVVLLHNDGVLPLQPTKTIAVVGPTADMMKVLEANYHGTASHPVTPLDGMRAEFKNVRYAQGSLLAAGVSAPIERSALRLGSGSDAGYGLKAEYFAKSSLEGAPLLTETVGKVDLDLDRVGPANGIGAKEYAVRWSGYVRPPGAGEYVLRTTVERCWDCTTHDAVKLYVDDKLVVDAKGTKGESDNATVHFGDGEAHAIRLELVRTGEDEGISLDWEPPADVLLKEAVDAAKDADVVVAFVGLSPDLEGEALQVHLDGFKGGDRVNLDLPVAQKALLTKLEEQGKPVVVVMTSGSAVAQGAEKAAALLEAWYPGEEGGAAIARLLDGKVNPSGRLPLTFYRSATDLPAFSDYGMKGRTYRYFEGNPLFGFGYGLSYSKFVYGPVRLARKKVVAGRPVVATVRLKNESGVDGTEVAELYVHPPAMDGAPRLALAGIERVSLKAGESRVVRFTLDPEQMSFVDAAGERAVRAGSYGITVSGVQPKAEDRGAELKITGSKVMTF